MIARRSSVSVVLEPDIVVFMRAPSRGWPGVGPTMPKDQATAHRLIPVIRACERTCSDAGSAAWQRDPALRVELPMPVVSDLPGMAVGVDENGRIAAPERLSGLARDPRTGRARLLDHRVDFRSESRSGAAIRPFSSTPTAIP